MTLQGSTHKGVLGNRYMMLEIIIMIRKWGVVS